MMTRIMIVVTFIVSFINVVYSNSLNTLDWKAGDILKCEYSGFSSFFGRMHWMIGTDESGHFICLTGSSETGKAQIEEHHFTDNIDNINKDNCFNYGKGKLPADEAVKEAKKWVGKTVSFNLNTCNNEHWIRYFTDGNSGKWFENQALKTVNADCEIPSEERRNHNINAMIWKPGDILKCRLTGFIGDMGAYHYMLGSDDSEHFIHVGGDWKTHKGLCFESSPAETNFIHHGSCDNLGKGKLSRDEAVANARKWVGKPVTYDILRCNCQHWVHYWANGDSGSFGDNQSLLPIDKDCDIKKQA